MSTPDQPPVPTPAPRLREAIALDALRSKLLGRASGPRTLGRYEIERAIGRGGMAEVFQALDPMLRRTVALKVVTGANVRRDRRRIVREARNQAGVSHPNVVEIYDVGVHEDGVYITMELLRGPTLRTWLEETHRPWRKIVETFRHAGEGLQAAHDLGLVHRDFKPANVLLTEDGIPKVADFGLAVRSHETASHASVAGRPSDDVRLTQTGHTMGTPMYMAPEQHQGAVLDARADQFSFCLALFEALYGDVPYLATTLEPLAIEKNTGPTLALPRPEGMPRRLESALVRGLSPKPNDRWPSLADLLHELEPPHSPYTHPVFLGGLGLAAVAGLAALSSSEDAGACRDPLAELWTPARIEQVGAAVVDHAAPGSAETWDRLVDEIDEWAERWNTDHTTACALTDRDERTAAVECLHRGAARLDAMLVALNEPGPDPLRQISVRLPPPAACLDPDAVPMPPEAIEIDRELARIGALTARYRIAESRERASKLLIRAHEAKLPSLEAEIAFELGVLDTVLMNTKRAQSHLEHAYFLADSIHDHTIAGDAASKLVFLLAQSGRDIAAERWVDLAHAHVVQADDVSVQAAFALAQGMLEHARGNFDVAEKHALRSASLASEGWGPSHVYVAMGYANAGYAQVSRGALDEGIATLERALEGYAKAGGARVPEQSIAMTNLGLALYRKGRYADALTRFDEVLEARHGHEGTSADDLGRLNVNRALCLAELGRTAEAVQTLSTARAQLIETLGPQHPLIAQVDMNEGVIQHTVGNVAQARNAYERAWAQQVDRLGADHPTTANTEHNLGVALNALGEPEAALAHLQRARAVFIETQGPDGDHTHIAGLEMGAVLHALGRDAEALPLIETSLAGLLAKADENSRWVVLARMYRGRALRGLRRLDASEAELARAQASFTAMPYQDTNLGAELSLDRGRTLVAVGRRAAARTLLDDAITLATNEPAAAQWLDELRALRDTLE